MCVSVYVSVSKSKLHANPMLTLQAYEQSHLALRPVPSLKITQLVSRSVYEIPRGWNETPLSVERLEAVKGYGSGGCVARSCMSHYGPCWRRHQPRKACGAIYRALVWGHNHLEERQKENDGKKLYMQRHSNNFRHF